jgi:hypothetical protein
MSVYGMECSSHESGGRNRLANLLLGAFATRRSGGDTAVALYWELCGMNAGFRSGMPDLEAAWASYPELAAHRELR